MRPRLAFVASSAPAAQAALQALEQGHGSAPEQEADVVVALGGDGLVLDVLHRLVHLPAPPPIYGMNRGTTGFLLNPYHPSDLPARIEAAAVTRVVPLACHAWSVAGEQLPVLRAFNEVALRRLSNQSARIRVLVDEVERLAELAGDGVLVA